MRFRDFVATVIISTCTCLLVVWALIGAGIIQTQQQIPQQQPIKQTHTGTLTGTYNETSQRYEAHIQRIPIENVSNKASIRLLHVSLDANVTNYNPDGTVGINYLRLIDQSLRVDIDEKSFIFMPKSYASLAIDRSIFPVHSHYLSLKADGTYNFTLVYTMTIIQEVFT